MIKYIILFSSLSLFAQNNLKVDYGVKYIEYYIEEQDTIGLPNFVKQRLANDENMKKKALESNTPIFSLLVSENISNFKFKDFMDIDDGLSFAILFMAARMQPIFKVEKYLYIEKDLLKKESAYEFFHLDIDWEIKEDYRTILGYKCQLAEAKVLSKTNRIFEVKAWFTTEIPISEGPSYFKGLPGLILGLEKHGRYTYAMDVKFPTNLNIKIPDNILTQIQKK